MYLEKRAAEATVANGSRVSAQSDAVGNLKIAQAPCNVTIVDLVTDTDVVVTASPAVLLGVRVNTVMSAHVALIKDSATTVISLPASTAAGTHVDCFSGKFATNITVESNDAATGTLAIFWRAL